jgi:hypothetical protein
LKMNQKVYGTIADSSGEGASSMDDWSIRSIFRICYNLIFNTYLFK